MNRRDLVLAASALAPSLAIGQPQRSLRDRLIGAWKLRDAETVNSATGEVSPFFGWARPYQGVLTYGASGMMTAQLCSRRTSPRTGVVFKGLAPEERLGFLDTYYAYFGRFEVDEARSHVHHVLEASLDPTEIGLTYVRLVKLDGELLTLSTTEKRFSTGSGSFNRLTWDRS